MPMIDLTLPEGALSEDTLDALSSDLMRALLRAERVPEENADRREISWLFVHELSPRRMYAGGRPNDGGPQFRMDVTVPDGALDDRRKGELIAEANELIVAASGAEDAQVWVLFHELGEWGAGGRRLTIEEIARIVGARRVAEAEPVGP